MNNGLIGFPQLRRRAIEYQGNKITFLVGCFSELHADAPPEDFTVCGDRLAGMVRLTNDYLIVLRMMWITSASGIQGSHLNYINKALSRERVEHQVDTTDRDKFVKGKYAHMVH